MEKNETREEESSALSQFESLWQLYFTLCVGAEDLRAKYYETAGGEAKLPVPIRAIAEEKGVLDERGIKIVERDLSILTSFIRMGSKSYADMPIGMPLGKLDYEAPGGITIHLERGISSFRKNYVIAHELGHYWIGKHILKKNPESSEKCIDALLPTSFTEVLSDIFSIFLLLPIGELFSAEKEYLNINSRRPVNLEEMLSYVSDIARVPYYYVLTGYEYIRIVICYIRNKDKATIEQIFSGNPLLNNIKNAAEEVINQIQQIDERFFDQKPQKHHKMAGD